MKVTIDKTQLSTELEQALKLSDSNYKKASVIYLKKIKQYIPYVERELKAGRRLTKYPPMLNSWERSDLKAALEALRLHKGINVEIDDRELTQLKDGIKRLHEDAETTMTSLNAVSYVDDR